MAMSRFFLVDADGNTLAELLAEEEAGWFTGKVLSRNLPDAAQRALAWYDEVVSGQMLSYLDEAVAAVDRLDLRVQSADGRVQRVFALHLSAEDDVSFRTSPVPPSSWLPASRLGER